MEASTKRPKGYVTWRPQTKTRILMDQVQEILEMYEENLPLTARQIFYRLVGAYDYEKTEKAYNRLTEALVRARRSLLIPFEYIRDDGTVHYAAPGFTSIDDWWADSERRAKRYLRRRDEGQPNIEVWCEAAGMAPQLSRVARQYGVPVYSTGGFSSVTVTHDVAQRVVREPRETIFLHIGDFDPSGQSIYEAMSEDIWTFVQQLKAPKLQEHLDIQDEVTDKFEFSYHRVALTEEQVEEYDLPTAPPKATDSRSERWVGETCQAEAMAPDELASILNSTIRSHMDWDKYLDVMSEEEEERDDLVQEVTEYIAGR